MMRSLARLLTVALPLATASAVRAQVPPPPPAPAEASPLAICVVENGVLREVPVLYDTETGDTLTLDGRPFSEAYPTDSNYVAAARWYIDDESFRFKEGVYLRYGLPVVLMPVELSPVGTFRGVTMFVRVGPRASTDFIFAPLRPGCEFQPYLNTMHYGPVRG